VILAAIMLKMGTYAFVRLMLPLTPAACFEYYPIMFLLAGIAIIYTAWVCMNQADLKRLIAYSSVAHMGYIIMGTFVLNWEGIVGAVLQMINHGICTGALFLIVGIIYERRHTRWISEYGGLFKIMPMYATYFAIVVLSSMGAPLLNGFVGEMFIIMGTFKVSKIYGFVCVAGVLTCAGYLLWMFQRVVLGEVTNEKNRGLKDLNLREYLYLSPLIAMIFFIGVYPKPLIEVLKPAVKNIVLMTKKGQIVKGSEGELALARLDQSTDKSNNEAPLVLVSQDNKEERDGNGHYTVTD
jgi:NADH-quinone oxidoreductase subunit M